MNFMVFRFKKNNKVKKYDRINFLTIVIFLLCGLVVLRLFNIQILQHGFYVALAEGQHELYQKLFPKRGEIFVQDKFAQSGLFPIATNQDLNLVYAVPKEIKGSKDEIAKKLSEILALDEEEVKMRISKENDLYEPLKHGVTDEVKAEIEKLNFQGIKFIAESYRYYPEKEIGSHILGFVGYIQDEKKGQYGLEGYFEKELAGKQGFLKAEKDAGGRWMTIGKTLLEEAEDGDNLILTIDHNIQFNACQKLSEAVQKHGADGGSLIIINPKTGEILAMCGAPDFDPNKYNEVQNIEVFKNPATYNTYEPGSVFKPITMASALDLGLVSPNTTYEDTGEVKIMNYTINNSDGKSNGVQTMTNVLEKSLNTGAIFAVQKVGNEKFEEYVQKFGFGKKTGLQLDSESSGDISALAKHKDIYSATASFGQGISVTPIQLINAFGAIANQGKLMKPYIVKEIVKPNGFKIENKPTEIRQVISSKTATTLSAMLVNVVRNGHGQKAGVAGYFVAGKTGTAQIPKKDGVGYEANLTIGTFCGFAPVDDPKFVMCVKIDIPRDVQWAESSAAPLFGDMAKYLLNYYQIPPTEEVEE
jgi:cell division protein FtsI/penicillin-binding protein 2